MTGCCSQCGRKFGADELMCLGGASVCASCKPMFVQPRREGAIVADAGKSAGVWIRCAAFLIDGSIGLAWIVGLMFVAGSEDLPLLYGSIVKFAGLLSVALIESWFLVCWGATPGKMVCGLRVIPAAGGEMPWGMAIKRSVTKVLTSVSCVVVLIAYLDDENRALHDRQCGTRVVRLK